MFKRKIAKTENNQFINKFNKENQKSLDNCNIQNDKIINSNPQERSFGTEI